MPLDPVIVPLVLAAGSLPEFFLWLGAAIGLVVVAGIGLMWYRSRAFGDAGPAADQAGLLESLRAMRDRGEMTPEEYDAARRSLAARFSGRLVTPRADAARPKTDGPLPSPPDERPSA